MTPDRLRECLALLNWTQRGLARALGRDEGTVRQWGKGTVKIPEDVAAGIEKLARYHERNPLPRKPIEASSTRSRGVQHRKAPEDHCPEAE